MLEIAEQECCKKLESYCHALYAWTWPCCAGYDSWKKMMKHRIPSQYLSTIQFLRLFNFSEFSANSIKSSRGVQTHLKFSFDNDFDHAWQSSFFIKKIRHKRVKLKNFLFVIVLVSNFTQILISLLKIILVLLIKHQCFQYDLKYLPS